MNNKMVNTMVIQSLNEVVNQINRVNGNTTHGRTVPTKLIKKVGLALSVLTSNKGELSPYDLSI